MKIRNLTLGATLAIVSILGLGCASQAGGPEEEHVAETRAALTPAQQECFDACMTARNASCPNAYDDPAGWTACFSKNGADCAAACTGNSGKGGPGKRPPIWKKM